MADKYHTLVIAADLGEHPRFVQINGVDYEVQASGVGHVMAELDPLSELVSDLANGQYSGHEADENIGVQTAALEAQDKSQSQRNKGYE